MVLTPYFYFELQRSESAQTCHPTDIEEAQEQARRQERLRPKHDGKARVLVAVLDGELSMKSMTNYRLAQRRELSGCNPCHKVP